MLPPPMKTASASSTARETLETSCTAVGEVHFLETGACLCCVGCPILKSKRDEEDFGGAVEEVADFVFYVIEIAAAMNRGVADE